MNSAYVVAAVPGWRALVEVEGTDANTPDDDLFIPVPVVAWSANVVAMQARPVLPPLPGEINRVFLQFDEGWIFGPDACFATLADLVDEIRREQQLDLERNDTDG